MSLDELVEKIPLEFVLLLEALSSRKALGLLLYLLENGEKSISEISETLEVEKEELKKIIKKLLSGGLIRQYVKELKDIGLDDKTYLDVSDTGKVLISSIYTGFLQLFGEATITVVKRFGKYYLKQPIVLSIRLEDEMEWDTICIENSKLGIVGCGDTLGEALDSVRIHFEACVESFALEQDDKLSKEALELKHKLLQYVQVNSKDVEKLK